MADESERLVPVSADRGHPRTEFTWDRMRDGGSEAPLLRDGRPLTPGFVPERLVGRTSECREVLQALAPLADGDEPDDILIGGPVGTGKSCLCRWALGEAERRLLDVETVYIDCFQHDNGFHVLYKLLEGVGRAYEVNRSTSANRMERVLDRITGRCVVVLDEFEQLGDIEPVTKIATYESVTLVLVTDRRLSQADPVVRTARNALSNPRTVAVDEYNHGTIGRILADRASRTLRDDAVGYGQLRRLATASRGDMGTALEILRTAVAMAVQSSEDGISSATVDRAIRRVQSGVPRKVRKLTDHKRTIYDIIDGSDRSRQPSAIYREYERRVDEPRTRRTMRNYLADLERHGLVESDGNGPSRVYRTSSR